MTDNTELQRLTRIRRLGRQIAASLPVDLDLEQAFQVHGDAHSHDLAAGARRRRTAPTSSKAVLRAELEAALANYRGPVALCPAAAPPSLDGSDDLSLVDDDGARLLPAALPHRGHCGPACQCSRADM